MHRGVWILQSQARIRVVPHVEIFEYAERQKFFGERYLPTESRAYGSQRPLKYFGAIIMVFSQLDIDLTWSYNGRQCTRSMPLTVQ